MSFKAPHDLASQLLTVWTAARGSSGLPLSQTSVYRLVELAFYASLTHDEGRPTRFRIVAASNPDLLIELAEPMPLDGIGMLRRMAPALSLPEAAILVGESQPGSLNITGICNLSRMTNRKPMIGLPFLLTSPPKPVLIVDVRGPGHLVAEIAPMSPHTLRSGTLHESSNFDRIPAFVSWIGGVEEIVRDQLLKWHPGASSAFLTSSLIKDSLSTFWSRVLLHVLEARHGGAFVLLPQITKTAEDVLRDYGIKCRFPADVWPFIDMAVLLDTCIEIQNALIVEEHNLARNRWLDQWQTVDAKAKAIADLANVDGCVVLDATSKVIGFGGEIRVHESDTPLPMVNANTGETLTDEAIREFGTRHRSAARLCQNRRGVLVFVVSQDAELRLFTSDDTTAQRYDGLDALGELRVLHREFPGPSTESAPQGQGDAPLSGP